MQGHVRGLQVLEGQEEEEVVQCAQQSGLGWAGRWQRLEQGEQCLSGDREGECVRPLFGVQCLSLRSTEEAGGRKQAGVFTNTTLGLGSSAASHPAWGPGCVSWGGR